MCVKNGLNGAVGGNHLDGIRGVNDIKGSMVQDDGSGQNKECK